MSFLHKDHDPPKECRIVSSMGSVAVFYAAYLGLSVEQISNETGIAPAVLMNPDTYLPETFFEKFFKMLADTFPGRNVALEMARTAPLSYLGAPGNLLRRSPDMRSMLELFEQYHDLLADRLEMKVIDWGKTETILRTHQPLSRQDGGIGAEVGLCMGARIAQECFGEEVLLRVQFCHSPIGPIAAYEDFFKAPVSFNAKFNAMFFASQCLERLNRKGRPELRGTLELRLQRLRQELDPAESDGLGEIRKAVLRNALKGDYSVSSLAKSVGMSISGLQRRLRSSGSSASKLLDEARQVNAMGLLSDRNRSIDDVAYQLGFESARGFCKAFRRWTGKSPAKVRNERLSAEMTMR
ncbi:helix-turn-helix domain-containing protein [Candidatus Electronema sp. PJ]|uniref:helix-turn-helix domain-containing protein n=1 Tax=Candidatus Electronema sp. PJ TaxID=3401572 RepID=UPI003AA84994